MASISVVINTLNEEHHLPAALKSVTNWAQEIVVVDMHSTDKTTEIAKSFGAKVFLHEPMGYVEPARNFAIAKATSEWILILDADEEIPSELAKKLESLAKASEYDYFSIPRKNIVFKKWLKYSRWWPDYNIRFFRKNAVSWMPEIHSIPLTQGKGMDLEAKVEFAIVHHNYDSIESFIQRLNRYSTVQAHEQKNAGRKSSWRNFIRKPVSEFLGRYFVGKGYKDGAHGLAVSLLQAFSELVVELKLWELSKFKEKEISLKTLSAELRNNQKEINYWVNEALVNETGGIISKVKRKFKLL